MHYCSVALGSSKTDLQGFSFQRGCLFARGWGNCSWHCASIGFSASCQRPTVLCYRTMPWHHGLCDTLHGCECHLTALGQAFRMRARDPQQHDELNASSSSVETCWCAVVKARFGARFQWLTHNSFEQQPWVYLSICITCCWIIFKFTFQSEGIILWFTIQSGSWRNFPNIAVIKSPLFAASSLCSVYVLSRNGGWPIHWFNGSPRHWSCVGLSMRNLQLSDQWGKTALILVWKAAITPSLKVPEERVPKHCKWFCCSVLQRKEVDSWPARTRWTYSPLGLWRVGPALLHEPLASIACVLSVQLQSFALST